MLNLDIIRDYLPEAIKAQRFGPASAELTITLPVLCESELNFSEDKLYVARVETLPQSPPLKSIPFVCVGKSLPQAWTNQKCQVLLVTESLGLFALFNMISEIFAKFNRWEQLMRDELELEDFFDIKNILSLGSTLLENPLSVVNGNMLRIYKSAITPSGSTGSLNIQTSEDRQDAYYKNYEKINESFRLERAIQEPYLSSAVLDGVRYYCCNLFKFGNYVGNISLRETHRPFHESDFVLADYFFVLFQKAYSRYLWRVVPLEYLGTAALENLINGVPLSLEEQNLFVLDQDEYWCCFKLNCLAKTQRLPIEYMLNTLNTIMPGVMLAAIRDGELVGLLRCQVSTASVSEDPLSNLYNILAKMGYTAGLSSSFLDIEQTYIHMKQASYAASIRDKFRNDNIIARFDEYILPYIFTSYNGEFPFNCLYPRGIKTLIEYDTNRNTDYLETLTEWLNNEMSVTGTAKKLYLHRTTLINRLGKIKKILNMDLDDPDVRLFLRVCLWMNQTEAN
jgi:hypothetical protein